MRGAERKVCLTRKHVSIRLPFKEHQRAYVSLAWVACNTIRLINSTVFACSSAAAGPVFVDIL